MHTRREGFHDFIMWSHFLFFGFTPTRMVLQVRKTRKLLARCQARCHDLYWRKTLETNDLSIASGRSYPIIVPNHVSESYSGFALKTRIQKLNIADNRTVESETFVSQFACTTFDKRAFNQVVLCGPEHLSKNMPSLIFCCSCKD